MVGSDVSWLTETSICRKPTHEADSLYARRAGSRLLTTERRERTQIHRRRFWRNEPTWHACVAGTLVLYMRSADDWFLRNEATAHPTEACLARESRTELRRTNPISSHARSAGSRGACENCANEPKADVLSNSNHNRAALHRFRENHR